MTVTLSAVIAQVESGNDPWKTRYEPTVYARYASVGDGGASVLAHQIKAFETLHGCSPDTARMLLSTSWGRYQAMGFNLNQHVVKFAADAAAQDAEFARFVGAIGVTGDQMADASWLSDDAAGLAFAAKYNGPGQPAAYLAALRVALSSLS